VFALIGNFDVNQDGKVSFGEFVQSLWHLQRRDDAKEHMAVSQSMLADPFASERMSILQNVVSARL